MSLVVHQHLFPLLMSQCHSPYVGENFDLGKKQLNWTPSAKSKTFVLKNVKGPWKKLSHENGTKNLSKLLFLNLD